MVPIPTPKVLNSSSSSASIRELPKFSWWAAGANTDNQIIFKYRVGPGRAGGNAHLGAAFTKGKGDESSNSALFSWIIN